MNPYNFAETLHDKAETLRRRYDADQCHVSHYDGGVSYQLEWEDEGEPRTASELLDHAQEVLGNLPSPEPDNVDFHAGFNLSVSFEYDFSVEEEEDETDDENPEKVEA